MLISISKLYINEKVTRKSRDLLKEVTLFKWTYNYKFVWTKHGRVLLRKDDGPSSQVNAFASMEEFDKFKRRTISHPSDE